MWLSLIIALLTYLLAPKDTAAERRRALLGAAVAGGATYAVTEYTDWGKTNLAPLDAAIEKAVLPTKSTGVVATVPGSAPTTIEGVPVGTTSIWDKLSGWVAPALATAGVASAAGALPAWVLPAGLILGIYLLVKD